MKKIKFKMTKNEVMALLKACEIALVQCDNNGISRLAARELISKLVMKLLGKSFTLKTRGNSISLSYPECWALSVLAPRILCLVGNYEQVVLQSITDEINHKTV